MINNKKDLIKLKQLNVAIKNSQAFNIDIRQDNKLIIFTVSILEKEIGEDQNKMKKPTMQDLIDLIQNQNKILNEKLDNNYQELNNKLDINYKILNEKLDSHYQELNNKLDFNYQTLNDKLDKHIVEFDSFKFKILSLPTIIRELKNSQN